MKNIFSIYTVPGIAALLFFALLYPTVSSGEQTASLVWSDSDSGHEQIYFSHYADGTWGSPVQLTESENLDYLPSTGMGEDGETWVVWSSKQKEEIVLMYTVLVDGGAWAEPRIIDTGMSSNTAVSLALDQDEIPWIVWAGFDGNDDEIFWSRWKGDEWSQAERVTGNNEVPDLLPKIVKDVQGVLTVRWKTFDGNSYVTASRSRIDEGWQEPVVKSRTSVRVTSGNRQIIPYPHLPDFIVDPAKAKMHVRSTRK